MGLSEWMAAIAMDSYTALKNYGFNALADDVAQRWINLNVKVFLKLWSELHHE